MHIVADAAHYGSVLDQAQHMLSDAEVPSFGSAPVARRGSVSTAMSASRHTVSTAQDSLTVSSKPWAEGIRLRSLCNGLAA